MLNKDELYELITKHATDVEYVEFAWGLSFEIGGRVWLNVHNSNPDYERLERFALEQFIIPNAKDANQEEMYRQSDAYWLSNSEYWDIPYDDEIDDNETIEDESK